MMQIKNAPKCSCGTPMILVASRLSLRWLCEKCYPNYPNRSKPLPHCPKCGIELKDEITGKWYCTSCKLSLKPRPHDIMICENDAVPIYREIIDNSVFYWWDESTPTPTHRPWKGPKKESEE